MAPVVVVIQQPAPVVLLSSSKLRPEGSCTAVAAATAGAWRAPGGVAKTILLFSLRVSKLQEVWKVAKAKAVPAVIMEKDRK